MLGFVVLLIIGCLNASVAEVELQIRDGLVRAQRVPPSTSSPESNTPAPQVTLIPHESEIISISEESNDLSEIILDNLMKIQSTPESAQDLDADAIKAPEIDDETEGTFHFVVNIWNGISSVDWVTIAKAYTFVAGTIVFCFLLWFLCKYIIFPCIRFCDYLQRICCCCLAEKVNALHEVDDGYDEADCHVVLDVYNYRNNIIEQT